LTHPTGHFWVNFFCKNLDVSYRHIYLGHPLKLKGVWAYIILVDFIIATPIFSCPPLAHMAKMAVVVAWTTMPWIIGCPSHACLRNNGIGRGADEGALALSALHHLLA
jgi:hypothetical protein